LSGHSASVRVRMSQRIASLSHGYQTTSAADGLVISRRVRDHDRGGAFTGTALTLVRTRTFSGGYSTTWTRPKPGSWRTSSTTAVRSASLTWTMTGPWTSERIHPILLVRTVVVKLGGMPRPTIQSELQPVGLAIGLWPIGRITEHRCQKNVEHNQWREAWSMYIALWAPIGKEKSRFMWGNALFCLGVAFFVLKRWCCLVMMNDA